MKHYKYSRTYHLKWSKGTTSDDRILPSVKHFEGKEIVVSEKIDGENTSMYRDHIHARSLDSLDHPSRHQVKKLHGEIQYDIPEGYRVVGENVFAKHSIHYKNLESYFYVFGIYNELNVCLSWDDTIEFSKLLGLMTVPVLYRGIWDEEKVKSCWTGISTASPNDDQEGYVVRVADSFPYDQQDNDLNSIFTAKMVREKHVQTSIHWMTEKIIPNSLRE